MALNNTRIYVFSDWRDSQQQSPDGRWVAFVELFYLALDGRLTATSIKPAADHQSSDVGPPVPLFVTQVGMVVRPILAGDAGT